MQTNIHENPSDNHEFPLHSKKFCRVCRADLDVVGGTNTVFFLPSADTERMPMCFPCVANLDFKVKRTRRAFARALLSLVLTRHTVEGGAL